MLELRTPRGLPVAVPETDAENTSPKFHAEELAEIAAYYREHGYDRPWAGHAHALQSYSRPMEQGSEALHVVYLPSSYCQGRTAFTEQARLGDEPDT